MSSRRTQGWVRNALLTVCAVVGLVLSVVALTTYYYLGNPDRLKPLLTHLVADFTGRTLAISGPLDIEISTTPRITVQQIRLSNAAWATQPDMLTADRVTLQLDLLQLLHGRLAVRDFEARGVVIDLEQSGEGAGNWRLSASEANGEKADEDSTEAPLILPFTVESLALQDIRIHLRRPDLVPLELVITRLVESTDTPGQVSLLGNGRLNQEPWQASGTIRPRSGGSASRGIDADLDLEIYTTDISVRGGIDDIVNLEGIDLELTMTGPDTRFYGELLGAPHLFEGDIALRGTLHPSSAGYDLEVSGHIAAFEVLADLAVADLRSFQTVAGTFHATGPDTSVLGRALGIPGLPDGPYRVDGQGRLSNGELALSELQVETANSRLTAQATLPNFPETEGGQATLEIEGTDLSHLEPLLGLSALISEPYSLRAELQADSGQFSATLVFGTHHVDATGTLGSEAGLSGMELAVKASGDDLGEISRVFERPELHGRYSVSWYISIDDSAVTVREFELHNGPFVINGSANLPEIESLEGLEATASFESPSLAEIGAYLDVEGLPDRRVDANVDLRIRKGRYDLEKSTLGLGEAQYQISGTLGTLRSLEGLALDISVSAPGLNAVLLQQLPEGYGQNPMHSSYRIIGQPGAVEIADFVMTAADSRLELDAHLALSPQLVGSHFRIQASGPRLDTLLPPGIGYQPPGVPYRLAGRLELPSENVLSFTELEMFVGDASARINGTIDLTTFSKTDLTVNASGSSMSELGHFNSRLLPDIPFDLDASLTGDDESIEISSLTLHWGDSDLQATGSLQIDEKPRFLLVGTSERLNVIDLQSVLGREETVGLDTKSVEAKTLLIPDVPIPFDALAWLDADVSLAIDNYEGRDLKLQGVDLRLKLENGGLDLERFAYKDHIGSFRISGSLQPENESGRFTLKIAGTDANLGILTAVDQPEDTIPRYSVDVDVRGTGRNLAEIAGSLDGNVLLHSDRGQISNNALQLWSGEFLDNVIRTLNPFSAPTDVYTPIDCVVVNAKLESGRLILEPGAVMRTDKVNIYVFGQANLADEQLDLLLATQPRQGVGLSAASITNPFFKIGGSFAKPALEVDTKNAALAAGFATATGGLSILAKGLWDRVRGQRNPCPDFMPKS